MNLALNTKVFEWNFFKRKEIELNHNKTNNNSDLLMTVEVQHRKSDDYTIYCASLLENIRPPECYLQVFSFKSSRMCSSCCFQPFQAHLAETTDPDKKQMLERLDAAVTAALQPLQAAMEGKSAAEVVQPLAQVRLSRPLPAFTINPSLERRMILMISSWFSSFQLLDFN